jgi:hypothetical protein
MFTRYSEWVFRQWALKAKTPTSDQNRMSQSRKPVTNDIAMHFLALQ